MKAITIFFWMTIPLVTFAQDKQPRKPAEAKGYFKCADFKRNTIEAIKTLVDIEKELNTWCTPGLPFQIIKQKDSYSYCCSDVR